jgi:hypothetical protein
MWVRTEPASGAHPSSSREPAVVDGASIANPSTLVLACLCLCSGGPRGRIVRPILEAVLKDIRKKFDKNYQCKTACFGALITRRRGKRVTYRAARVGRGAGGATIPPVPVRSALGLGGLRQVSIKRDAPGHD